MRMIFGAKLVELVLIYFFLLLRMFLAHRNEPEMTPTDALPLPNIVGRTDATTRDCIGVLAPTFLLHPTQLRMNHTDILSSAVFPYQKRGNTWNRVLPVKESRCAISRLRSPKPRQNS